MEWSDDAIVLSVRRYGESSAILEGLTREHGRHLGLIRGGASHRLRPTLQRGNTLRLNWRARLSEHLGGYTAELVRARAGDVIENRQALVGVNAFSSVASSALPEREEHTPVFEAGEILLDAIVNEDLLHWGPLFVRWEAGLLEALGFGLDLSRCAATGRTEDLRYVSPKSGRAVSDEAAAPYRERLLALPPYLLGSQAGEPMLSEIAAGLNLTGHFLLERVLRPHQQTMPPARLRLAAMAGAESS
jgi:DNA repair protein RecO (recombination protein O)